MTSKIETSARVSPIIPDGGPGEALLIVTVEVVPGLSLGSPSWPLLAKTEWQVWWTDHWSSSKREAGRFVEERGRVRLSRPFCLPTSGPQAPFF